MNSIRAFKMFIGSDGMTGVGLDLIAIGNGNECNWVML